MLLSGGVLWATGSNWLAWLSRESGDSLFDSVHRYNQPIKWWTVIFTLLFLYGSNTLLTEQSQASCCSRVCGYNLVCVQVVRTPLLDNSNMLILMSYGYSDRGKRWGHFENQHLPYMYYKITKKNTNPTTQWKLNFYGLCHFWKCQCLFYNSWNWSFRKFHTLLMNWENRTPFEGTVFPTASRLSDKQSQSAAKYILTDMKDSLLN